MIDRAEVERALIERDQHRINAHEEGRHLPPMGAIEKAARAWLAGQNVTVTEEMAEKALNTFYDERLFPANKGKWLSAIVESMTRAIEAALAARKEVMPADRAAQATADTRPGQDSANLRRGDEPRRIMQTLVRRNLPPNRGPRPRSTRGAIP